MNELKNYYCLVLLLCVYIRTTWAIPRIDPLVETNIGLIRGVQSSDGMYSMFLGIPYAAVDSSNPFGVSTPHPGFDEVFDAYDDSAICPQAEPFNNTITGSLDCLHLSVYVPNSANSKNQLPVLVWIYGGAFETGFSSRYVYGPSYLVRHDVILVTLNYRVGPYGFMCLETPEVPGNQGLKDQLLALRWVNNHISAFGGDINKITLFGESAGGHSVDLHLHYNKENLFNKVIMQSGNVFGSGYYTEPDNTLPLKIAKHLGFSSNDVNEVIIFLSKVDTDLVIAASSELNIDYQACIENKYEGVEYFLMEHPLNVDVPRARNVSILIGHNDDEQVTNKPFYKNDQIIQERLLDYFNFDNDTLAEVATLVKHFYIGEEDFNEQSVISLINFDSDIKFVYSTKRSIDKYIQNGVKDVYQYMFSYNGTRNIYKILTNLPEGGAAHADDIGYLFDVSYIRENTSPEDQLIIDRMTTLWTNFAKYGNPTPETNDLLPVTWLPVTKDTRNYLNIDLELSLGRRPFHRRMAFLDLFYNINKRFEKGFQDNRV